MLDVSSPPAGAIKIHIEVLEGGATGIDLSLEETGGVGNERHVQIFDIPAEIIDRTVAIKGALADPQSAATDGADITLTFTFKETTGDKAAMNPSPPPDVA